MKRGQEYSFSLNLLLAQSGQRKKETVTALEMPAWAGCEFWSCGQLKEPACWGRLFSAPFDLILTVFTNNLNVCICRNICLPLNPIIFSHYCGVNQKCPIYRLGTATTVCGL